MPFYPNGVSVSLAIPLTAYGPMAAAAAAAAVVRGTKTEKASLFHLNIIISHINRITFET